MKHADWERLVSQPRFDRYLVACGGRAPKAAQLYKFNIRLAQAFHPVLGLFEVVLRNKIDETMSFYFKDTDWILNKKNILGGKLYRMAFDTERKLTSYSLPPTNGMVVSNLMLGFWTEFFEKQPFKSLKGSPLHVFKDLPPSLDRKDVALKLNQIRIFRNRINHNESICFKGSAIDFSEANEVYRSILETMNWIDPVAPTILKGLDSVPATLRKAALF